MIDGAQATSYVYDDANRMTTTTFASENGDLTGRGSDTFGWDYEDRMTSATANSTTTTFAYRGDGLRLRREHRLQRSMSQGQRLWP